MAEIRHLDKAPITEALIDLRVVIPTDSIGKLKELADRVKDRFPKQYTLHHGEFKFQIAAEGPNSEQVTTGVLGYICSGNDDTRKVQFRGDGFTFNKLKPYETWEMMRDEARELWGMFSVSVAAGIPIHRVAIRYINLLEIPLGGPLGDFLTAPPVSPKGLPQGVYEYLHRIVLKEEELNAVAIITQNMLPSLPEHGASKRLLFDIDIFRDNANLNQEEVWDVLEGFRKFKNEIFFKSLTERTVEKYT